MYTNYHFIILDFSDQHYSLASGPVLFQCYNSLCPQAFCIILFSLSPSRKCRPVMHPAALNLTHSLTAHDSGPPSTNSAHVHAHQHPALSPGVLSPALDSIRIQWGSNGGRSHGNKEGHKNEKLGHQSLKGTCPLSLEIS